MLKQRIITAAILIPIVVWGIFYLPLLWFGWVSAAVLLLAAWEWGRLAGLKTVPARILFLFLTLVFFWLLGASDPNYLLTLGVLTWVVLPLFLGNPTLWGRYWRRSLLLRLILGIWLLGLTWYALNFIVSQGWGSILLLTLFLWVWGADTGAYFVGRAYGKHKLAPQISPGKTWEGVLGGVCTAMFLAMIMGFFLPFTAAYYFGFLLLGLVVVIVSVLGDLFESMIKRASQVKDSGSLLPGHGGLLDRIDSLISAAPIFAAGLAVLNVLK